MEHHTNTSRAEAERLLGIAEKLLRSKDFNSCKDFAVLAQETEPLLEGSEQILAVADVLVAGEKRVNKQQDWYAILQISQRSDDSELIKKQYRRLALLLHPDKNKFAFADSAFRLVADAWAVLSDPGKKSVYDNEFSLFTKVDLAEMKRQKDSQPPPQQQQQPQHTPRPQRQQAANDLSQQKLPVRRSARATNNPNNNADANVDGRSNSGPVKKGTNFDSNVSTASGRGCKGRSAFNFWSACPYCYMLYEYPRMYEGCCLKCQNCERAFTGMEVYSKPPTIPGTDTYYCCWGFFPMGFSLGDLDGEKINDAGAAAAAAAAGFQNWMPPMFPASNVVEEHVNVASVGAGGGVAHTVGAGAGFVTGGMPGLGSGTGVIGSGSGGGPSGGGPSGGGTSGGGRGGRGRGNASAKVPNEGAKKRGRPKKNP